MANEEVKPTCKRIKHLDMLKGLGILFIIMGHVDFGEYFDTYIHSFVIALFFFISGFLFKHKDYVVFIKKKFNTLIIPYLKYGMLNFVMCLFFIYHFKIGEYFETFLFYTNHLLTITGALWFLTCLFSINILFYIITKYLNKFWSAILIILMVTCLYLTKYEIPFSIDSAIYMLPVFYVGYIFRYVLSKKENQNEKRQIFIGLVLLIVFSLAALANGYVDVRTNTYSNIFLFYECAIFISIGFFYFSKLTEKYLPTKIFEYCGEHALTLMCLNQMVLFMVGKLHLKSSVLIFLLVFLILVIIIEFKNIPSYLKLMINKIKHRI